MSHPPQSYPPQGHLPGRTPGVPDARAYQPRTIAPQVRTEQPQHSALTLGQYYRSDLRGTPEGRRPRWAGRLAFWLGLVSVPLLWVVGTIFELHAFSYAAAALSVVAIFFGLVALIMGIGRLSGFFGIVLALLGNIYVISLLDTLLNGR